MNSQDLKVGSVVNGNIGFGIEMKDFIVISCTEKQLTFKCEATTYTVNNLASGRTIHLKRNTIRISRKLLQIILDNKHKNCNAIIVSL